MRFSYRPAMATRSASAAPTRFEGFADADARFFHALARNQTRAWFQAHRHEYETGWVAPMHRLLAELCEAIDPYFARHPLGEPKVFRIYRDVRFSKDKSPFKTHVGGYVPLQSDVRGPAQPIAVYVQLGTETFVGAGHYMMDAAQLARYRAAVLDDAAGAELARLVAGARKAGCRLGGRETLQRVPRGVDPDHPRAELLKHKGLTLHFGAVPKRLIASRALLGWIAREVKKAAPVVEWLAEVTG